MDLPSELPPPRAPHEAGPMDLPSELPPPRAPHEAGPMDLPSELPPPRAPHEAGPMDLPPWAPRLTDHVVTLRAHRPDDVDGAVAQCRDPLMQRWTTVPVPYERHHAEEWIGTRERDWRQGTFLAFAVEADGVFCGSV